MKRKSKIVQGVMCNKIKKLCNIPMIYAILIIMISTCQAKQITLFDANDQVEFAKFSDYTIKFSELESLKLADFFYEHSFISVIANVTLTNECLKKSSVIVFL
jgi:hypothetical protein